MSMKMKDEQPRGSKYLDNFLCREGQLDIDQHSIECSFF